MRLTCKSLPTKALEALMTAAISAAIGGASSVISAKYRRSSRPLLMTAELVKLCKAVTE